MEIRGLKANRKMAAGLTAPKAKATGTTSHHKSSPEAQDADDLLDLEGEFAEDEGAAMLKAVRERKTQHKSRGLQTTLTHTKMGTTTTSNVCILSIRFM